jgi:hypothetical protein
MLPERSSCSRLLRLHHQLGLIGGVRRADPFTYGGTPDPLPLGVDVLQPNRAAGDEPALLIGDPHIPQLLDPGTGTAATSIRLLRIERRRSVLLFAPTAN